MCWKYLSPCVLKLQKLVSTWILPPNLGQSPQEFQPVLQKLRGLGRVCFFILIVPLITPKNVFREYKFPFSPDHQCEQIIVLATFVNFLRIFKVYNFAHFHVHDRGMASDVISWISMLCFWEEYMRARGSVCQNRCRMQGIWVVGDCSNTGYVG